MDEYKFYFQQVDKTGAAGTKMDFEATYPRSNYLYCKGLETVGAAKNIYTEDYPEADGLRSYHPKDTEKEVTHSSTTIELSLIFAGDSRRANYNSFMSFIQSSRFYYWDTARLKKIFCVVMEEQTVEEDTLTGIKYIQVILNLKNLWGISKACDENGNV